MSSNRGMLMCMSILPFPLQAFALKVRASSGNEGGFVVHLYL